jgi:hypothetical protein
MKLIRVLHPDKLILIENHSPKKLPYGYTTIN